MRLCSQEMTKVYVATLGRGAALQKEGSAHMEVQWNEKEETTLNLLIYHILMFRQHFIRVLVQLWNLANFLFLLFSRVALYHFYLP